MHFRIREVIRLDGRKHVIENRFDEFDRWKLLVQGFGEAHYAERAIRRLRSMHTVGQVSINLINEMSTESDEWYAYTNEDQKSEGLGDVKFVPMGPDRIFSSPPKDFESAGVTYILTGRVSLDSGAINK